MTPIVSLDAILMLRGGGGGGGRDYNKVKGLQAAFSKIRASFCSKTHTGGFARSAKAC